jgi:hypothetical protein
MTAVGRDAFLERASALMRMLRELVSLLLIVREFAIS